MSKSHQRYADEIDLIGVFKSLWNNKSKIFFITLIFGILGILYSNFILKNDYQIINKISEGKPSSLNQFRSLNKILSEKRISYEINQENIFNMFVQEFNDYDEIIEVLSLNNNIKLYTSGLSEDEKNRMIEKLSSRFVLIAPSKKKGGGWRITFNWHNKDEAIYLLNEILNKTIQNVKKTIAKDLNEISIFIEKNNARYIEDLNFDLLIMKNKTEKEINGKLAFLKGQAEIAKELNIENNTLSSNDLKQTTNNNLSLSIQPSPMSSYYLPTPPYYLRGYKAIEKEIEILTDRSEEERLLLTDVNLSENGDFISNRGLNYIEIITKIIALKGDLTPKQINSYVDTVNKANTKGWVTYERSGNINSKKGSKFFYVLIFIFLGLLLSSLYFILTDFNANPSNLRINKKSSK